MKTGRDIVECRIVYSDRKTVGITVKNAQVIVRAPKGMSDEQIRVIIKRHEGWILDKIRKQEELLKKDSRFDFSALSEREIIDLVALAKEYFEVKTREYAAKMDLKYNKIKITRALSRFGSCNSKGIICFSFRLMLYPEMAREYVIVHELCHLKEMNHSKRFYALVSRYMPDYLERKKLLKAPI